MVAWDICEPGGAVVAWGRVCYLSLLHFPQLTCDKQDIVTV